VICEEFANLLGYVNKYFYKSDLLVGLLVISVTAQAKICVEGEAGRL
jgi:hypothetical protein